MAATRAAQNRKIRQDNLREWLSEKCTLQHLVENITKIETQGGTMDAQELNAIKIANDQRIKLINKYLPDLKSTELTGEGGGPVSHELWLENLADNE